MSTSPKKLHRNQIKNKNFQILEICILQPLSVKFISKTVKERGKYANILTKALNTIQSTTKNASKLD